MNHKHTKISYPMLIITLIVLLIFVNVYITALAEPPSYNSGPNLAVTTIMVLILFVLVFFGVFRK